MTGIFVPQIPWCPVCKLVKCTCKKPKKVKK